MSIDDIERLWLDYLGDDVGFLMDGLVIQDVTLPLGMGVRDWLDECGCYRELELVLDFVGCLDASV